MVLIHLDTSGYLFEVGEWFKVNTGNCGWLLVFFGSDDSPVGAPGISVMEVPRDQSQGIQGVWGICEAKQPQL